MIVRILTAVAALFAMASVAHAFVKWEPRPLTDAEHAIVLEKLDGYSDEDREFIIGRMAGSIEAEKAGDDKTYDENASIIAFGASTERGKHIESVITELEHVVSEPCGEGKIRVKRQCHWDRGTYKSYVELFHNHYYKGCTEGRSFGRCD